VNGLCPKFGVGLLRKPDNEPYQFYNTAYELIPFEIDWQVSGASVTFNTREKECLGYAMRETKTVTVEGNRLIVCHEMENRGKKNLALSEYNHNFVSIDKQPIGKEYFLHFPAIANQSGKRDKTPGSTIYGDGKGFTFSGYCAKAASIGVEKNEIESGLPFRWTLTHSGVQKSVTEEVSFTPDSVHIWTIDHIISPEVFHSFSLAPGERCSYTRSWVFGV